MEIMLDTNFILTCVRQKVDFASLANELTDEEVIFLVPSEVLNELKELSTRKGMKIIDKDAALLSLKILETIEPKPREVFLGNKTVDNGIINYIKDKDIILATLDKGLKRKVSNKVLTIKGRKNLGFVED
jgi:rRNA-processing protein FCF1